MIHELKTIEPFFSHLGCRNKNFEVRKNDRNFNPGDYLRLRKYDVETQTYSGDELVVKVNYILHDENYCKGGYCIMGIEFGYGEITSLSITHD